MFLTIGVSSLLDFTGLLSSSRSLLGLKGHSRVAAACWGLKLYSDAREAYERGLKLEPDDHVLQRGRAYGHAMLACVPSHSLLSLPEHKKSLAVRFVSCMRDCLPTGCDGHIHFHSLRTLMHLVNSRTKLQAHVDLEEMCGKAAHSHASRITATGLLGTLQESLQLAC
eukprot:1161882-Pelagomonas_calceolata.AAC.15